MKNGSMVLVMAIVHVLGAAAAVSGSGCGFEPWSSGVSEIVFGVEQQKTADGKVVTSSSYELLSLGGRGWNARGFLDRGRSCWIEALDQRLGQPRMETGIATFSGAKLPAEGLVVRANQRDATRLDGAAWAAGDRLQFEAHGFAMPDVWKIDMRAPSPDLAITQPDAQAELALKSDADFVATWAGADVPEAVVVSLEVAADAERGHEVRCFFDRRAGKGTVPRSLVAQLPDTSATVKGTLRVATHTQVSLILRGEWVVYVVAGALQREQAFTLTR
jgi:hypothetical protein